MNGKEFLNDYREKLNPVLDEEDGENAGYRIAPMVLEAKAMQSSEELLYSTLCIGENVDEATSGDMQAVQEFVYGLKLKLGIIRWCLDQRYGAKTLN